jgi:hypothetical protein
MTPKGAFVKSNRLMVHAGALAVAIAILALPGFAALARSAAQDPPPVVAAADSTMHADSTAARPTSPTAPATAAPSPAMAPTSAPADTGVVTPPPQVAPAPTPGPAPTPAPPIAAPVKARPEKRARPVKVKAVAVADSLSGESRNPWAKGTNWVTLNAGYARSGEPGSAQGSYGFGVGVKHMLNTRYSVALSGGFDQLGRFDTAKEWQYPFTIAIARHFAWKTIARPYFEFGYGVFQHSFRGTGQDTHKTMTGTTYTGGIDMPTGGRGMIGAYARYEYLTNEKDRKTNPVFDGERNFAVRYALRVTYSLLF